jgi:hypothetical protein
MSVNVEFTHPFDCSFLDSGPGHCREYDQSTDIGSTAHGEESVDDESDKEDDEDMLPKCPRCDCLFSLAAERAPKTLPCQHLCCFSCVLDSLRDCVVVCPQCGEGHSIADAVDSSTTGANDARKASDLVRGLPTCVVVTEFLQLLTAKNSTNDDCKPSSQPTGNIPHTALPIDNMVLHPTPAADSDTGTRAPNHDSPAKAACRISDGDIACIDKDEFSVDEAHLNAPSVQSKFTMRTRKISDDRARASKDHLPAVSPCSRDQKDPVSDDGGERARIVHPATNISTLPEDRARKKREKHRQERIQDKEAQTDDQDELLLDLPITCLPPRTAQAKTAGKNGVAKAYTPPAVPARMGSNDAANADDDHDDLTLDQRRQCQLMYRQRDFDGDINRSNGGRSGVAPGEIAQEDDDAEALLDLPISRLPLKAMKADTQVSSPAKPGVKPKFAPAPDSMLSDDADDDLTLDQRRLRLRKLAQLLQQQHSNSLDDNAQCSVGCEHQEIPADRMHRDQRPNRKTRSAPHAELERGRVTTVHPMLRAECSRESSSGMPKSEGSGLDVQEEKPVAKVPIEVLNKVENHPSVSRTCLDQQWHGCVTHTDAAKTVQVRPCRSPQRQRKTVERIRSSDLVACNKPSSSAHGAADGSERLGHGGRGEDEMDRNCGGESSVGRAGQRALQAEQDAVMLVEEKGQRTWEDHFKLLEAYKERFSHACPPAHCPVFGTKFGMWTALQVCTPRGMLLRWRSLRMGVGRVS